MKFSIRDLFLLTTIVVVACCSPVSLFGQPDGEARFFDPETRTELVRNKAGEVVSIHFAGSPDWLVRQSDERSHWHKFPGLKTIALSHTSVTKEQLRYIAGLKSVTSLHLSCLAEEIELPGSALIALKDMDSLELLDIVDDGFVEENWDFLSGLKSLKSLTIRGSITERVLVRILKHEKLTELWIGGIVGEVSDESAKLLSALSSLEKAHFGPVNDASPFLRHLHTNNALKDLELVAPSLDKADVTLVAHLVNLQRLSLGGQQPGMVGQLGSLAKLKFLRLRFARGSELSDLSFLKHFPDLEFLDLANVTARNPSLQDIRHHRKLGYLRLSHIVLDMTAIEVLTSIPTLTYLSVGNTEGSEWCATARKRLPKVTIEATKKPE